MKTTDAATVALEDVWTPDAEPEDRGNGECKYAVVDRAPFDSSATYWREYANACKIVASHPEGANLQTILRELHGENPPESGSTEYQRIRRFLSSNPEFFAVRQADGLIRAAPTLELLDLINGGIIQNHRETAQRGNAEFCADVLKSVGEVNDKGENLLEFNLKEYVDRINDLRLILHSEEADPEYVSLPYKTRFNDSGRINKQWSVMSSAIEKAGEWFDNAALLTLTTDPKKFDSLYEMWDNINQSWNRMMSWLSSDAHLGYRPQYLKVLEATEAGYPHIHAIVFLEDESTRGDMPYVEDKQAIADYWDKYQGRIVDVQPLRWVDDLGDQYEAESGWVRWQADGDHGGDLGGDGLEDRAGQTAGEYLGKYMSAVYGGIRGVNGPEVMTDGGQPVDDEMTEKYEDKAATWKIAMYWATGRKIRTESRDLRQAVEEEMEDEDDEQKAEAAEIIRECRYEFVGAFPDHQIPDHIRRELAAIDALMNELEDVDNTGKVVGAVPTPKVPDRLPDHLEGSGLIYKQRLEDDGGDEQGDDRGDGGTAAGFM